MVDHLSVYRSLRRCTQLRKSVSLPTKGQQDNTSLTRVDTVPVIDSFCYKLAFPINVPRRSDEDFDYTCVITHTAVYTLPRALSAQNPATRDRMSVVRGIAAHQPALLKGPQGRR
jgi:hypothetical protein